MRWIRRLWMGVIAFHPSLKAFLLRDRSVTWSTCSRTPLMPFQACESESMRMTPAPCDSQKSSAAMYAVGP